eukprot:gnl/Spiro4/8159_TR4295_c0_g1_i1.p1 gnl/Spiro4/8159_TR4295_c0_g1~~gnl/Spiro4/8159_TR4295_c0_g1_i1.p1  ORF type:complete len:210 (-),score=44.57 gnl/Spiro4/8159_TR4295_c0_g1_i1:168-797(-)
MLCTLLCCVLLLLHPNEATVQTAAGSAALIYSGSSFDNDGLAMEESDYLEHSNSFVAQDGTGSYPHQKLQEGLLPGEPLTAPLPQVPPGSVWSDLELTDPYVIEGAKFALQQLNHGAEGSEAGGWFYRSTLNAATQIDAPSDTIKIQLQLLLQRGTKFACEQLRTVEVDIPAPPPQARWTSPAAAGWKFVDSDIKLPGVCGEAEAEAGH